MVAGSLRRKKNHTLLYTYNKYYIVAFVSLDGGVTFQLLLKTGHFVSGGKKPPQCYHTHTHITNIIIIYTKRRAGERETSKRLLFLFLYITYALIYMLTFNIVDWSVGIFGNENGIAAIDRILLIFFSFIL